MQRLWNSCLAYTRLVEDHRFTSCKVHACIHEIIPCGISGRVNWPCCHVSDHSISWPKVSACHSGLQINTDWSSANILTIMLFTLHCIQMYIYTAPSLDICFVVTAILERNALHCSTSSPRVEPAPSWCAPLHFTWTEIIQNLIINRIHNSTFRKTQWCHLIKNK